MISGSQLRDAIISGSNSITNHKREINELNIFPVPDGDTGTNMSLTINAAAEILKDLPENITAQEVAKKTASAMLRGARGNSGVILSLLFRGISKGIEGYDELDADIFLDAFDIGVDEAYSAVMKPTEGTILTVARVAAENARKALEESLECSTIFSAVCDGAYEALATTPDLLPVLKRAGVVDAGGKGLCLIFDGMKSVIEDGKIISITRPEDEKQAETEEFFRNVAAEFDSEITFTYCTEFIIGRDIECKKDPNDLRLFLETIGDCVVVVDDEEIIKTHVHTENPGLALEKALEYGSLLTIKIDNMKEQHRKAAEENDAKKAAYAEIPETPKAQKFAAAEPTGEIGFVSVAAGDGLISLFEDLGCDNVISGGQTMNPSTEDILAAVLATPAKKVFVLPNNKNILLSAEQTVPLAKDREIIVIPTRTIPQGIAAMLAYDPESDTNSNKDIMTEAIGSVQSGAVTFAARDSEFGGQKIKMNDIIGLENGKLEHIEKDPVSACVKVTKSLLRKSSNFVTLIYGNGISELEAERAKNILQTKLKANAEITLVRGDQPLYYFIISVE